MIRSLTYLCVFICVQVFVQSDVLDNGKEIPEKWISFKSQHSKRYETGKEDERRMKIYSDNLRKIARHNERFKKGEVTYELGINQFSDLSNEEFAKIYLSKFDINQNISAVSINETSILRAASPKYKNWVEEGKVTLVKNQGYCGSCWAFATIGTIESHVAIATRKLHDLSPQNLLDCTGGYNSCDGGFMQQAFDYVKRNRGIATEKSYPYRGRKGNCRYKSNSKGASIQGYKSIRSSEQTMKQVVGTIGPVTVGINCGNLLQSYRSGIFSTQNQGSISGHALVIVGYGTESGIDYWLAKNSWSQNWGMKGYLKIARNRNTCGISSEALYPTGAR